MVRASWIAKSIGDDAEPLGPADAMLDRDTEAAETPVVFLLLVGQFAALWLLVWDVQIGVLLVIALICAVGVAARLLGQRVPSRRIVRS